MYTKPFSVLSVPNSPAVCPRDHGTAGCLQCVYHEGVPEPGRHADGE